jgi:redox-sensitive bicupin YhaK (pirin superfamily)
MAETQLNRLPASHALIRGHGPFQLRRIRPGLGLADQSGDTAFGPLGLIDHAHLSPGLIVRMHEHRNDEIISYLRHGTMWHEDTAGARLPLDSTHLAVMNSGSGLSHEESVPPSGEPVNMLQIFVRPRSADLPPRFQHLPLATARHADGWRLLVVPEGEPGPAFVRNRIWLHDTFLPRAGAQIRTPLQAATDGWLYVFSGAISVNGGLRLETGDSLRVIQHAPVNLEAETASDLVMISVDRSAPASRAGTLSGRS